MADKPSTSAGAHTPTNSNDRTWKIDIGVVKPSEPCPPPPSYQGMERQPTPSPQTASKPTAQNTSKEGKSARDLDISGFILALVLLGIFNLVGFIALGNQLNHLGISKEGCVHGTNLPSGAMHARSGSLVGRDASPDPTPILIVPDTNANANAHPVRPKAILEVASADNRTILVEGRGGRGS
ncbi:hypothetical protein BO70DRAFT_382003 [Aspergillus heteromorphus CBS 117.55]|uniref:Uncharacterized protein n=1 Tax=Aspergillus heteromorphus CBS 117.55 TaxID=1448321 RepID=A0A317VBE9_9EURO|nr:uncharacterized protein BO70DRAFT_382003 [Aspergillus heteromorphus CBS 117.55]PWY71683.1 hypothetical protein BO70DRAFT_382003 [Aspergillus heteromorphus CBS 117.55]